MSDFSDAAKWAQQVAKATNQLHESNQQLSSPPAFPMNSGAQALLAQRPLMSLLPGQAPGTGGVIPPGAGLGGGMVQPNGQPAAALPAAKSAFLPAPHMLNGQSLYSQGPQPQSPGQTQTEMQQLLAQLRAQQAAGPTGAGGTGGTQ